MLRHAHASPHPRLRYHPDLNKEKDAAAKFEAVQSSYDILSDDAKKSAFDSYGHAGVDASEAGGGPSGGGGGGGGFEEQFMGAEELFNRMFSEMGGGGGGRGGSPHCVSAGLQGTLAV